ncbi:ribosomal protein S18-alanine N-acetyltransferase [Canibacter sp. lx-72]|uniref:ribosomal protein S18-alanine N-acetyltransferase n=1 Tax=Canibacter zhuwentaonis TaxID=2837491 RepID=UPI001BDC44B7|nr:ribosomal protein S18-alanine N-acetyltransferase [Canibacter zhuwentaonis]MBT1018158.1 ribosomal protein S18-alanine N-acetyltransferase [Canibacter zhuwentaonis]
MTSAAQITIRQATVADCEAIFALEQELFGTDAWSQNLVRGELTAPHRTYWVLETAAHEIVGYAGLLALGSEADLQTIAVAAQYQGCGLGQLLLDKIVASALAAGAKQLFLEVRADNPPAIKLYQKNGFEQIAIRPKYYQPAGVDALIMRAFL